MVRYQRSRAKPDEQSHAESWQEIMEKKLAESKLLLRQQVQDFNQWLTQQKVL
jgi:hypothetical protein